MEKKEPSPPMKPWLSTALGIVIPALVTVILFTYVTFFVTIPHIKENLLQGQYNIVQAEVSTVLSTLYHYYQLEHEGKISKQTAQNSAKEIIRHLRYGDNEYFFIVDYNYFSIMHPLRPYLENKNMADIKDSNGKPFIKLLVDMAKQKQQGFLNYMWYPKGNQQQKQIPKVAYVKCFAPWQWVVGSGIYMGDALHQIKLTVRKTIIINLTIICITLLLLLIIIFQSIKTIKKQQLTQQALQESEQQLRLMYMNSPNAIVLITDKKVVACNPAAEKMMGFCSQDIIGKSANEFSPLFQPDGKPSNEKALEKMALVRTEGPQRFEWILQKKDGTTLWIDVMISSLLYHNKPSIMASWRDITERKTMEAELRDSNQALAAEKERLAVTLRSIGDGVITTDTQGKVLSLNKVAEKLTGWSHQEACGQYLSSIFIIINEITKLPCENPVSKVLTTKGMVELENHTLLISRDGTQRVIADSGAPIQNTNGEIIGVVLVFRDMTEKRKLIEAAQKNQKLDSLGVLAGGIAHDFNNFLCGILGNIELANANTDDTKISDYLTHALNSAERARGLTLQLLTFAKGGAPIKKIGNLAPLIEEVTRFALSGSNISCRFNIDAHLWPCNFDKTQLGQVFDNLTINAKQAMPNGGLLEVTAQNISLKEKEHITLTTGSYLKISFKDNGYGIAKEIQPHIFDPFFTTKEEGNGLGLATCYSIINRHNGVIDVESEPPMGTTFHIYLPAAEANTATVTINPAITHHGQGNILVMDDDPTIRLIFEQMLKTLGYTAILKRDGQEALDFFIKEHLAHHPLVAIFLDLTVPGGLGGKETVTQLRTINKDIPIFVASGYGEKFPIISNPTEYGFTASLCKPFLLTDLAELLNKYLPK